MDRENGQIIAVFCKRQWCDLICENVLNQAENRILHMIVVAPDWLAQAAMSTQWTFLWLPPTSWLYEKFLAVRLICKKYKFGNLYFGWGERKALIAKFDPDLFKTPNQLWNLGVHLALNLFPKTTCFSCSQIIVIAFIWLDDMCGIFQLVQKALS